MIEFLGQLGIDWRILIAQIVNFVILLWFLNRFLYKPIIKEVEKNEQELNQAQAQKTQLIAEKEGFLKDKNASIIETKKKSQSSIREAKLVAGKLSDAAQEEVEKLKNKLMEQTKLQMENEKKSLTKTREHQASLLIFSNLKENFQQRIFSQPELQNQLNAAFWELLRSRMSNVTALHNVDDNETVVFEKGKDLSPYLEYVFPLTEDQLNALQTIVKKKAKIVTKENKNLICGFLMEMDGLVIEANLLYEITQAYER